jgi:hypothetical protein
MADPWITEPGRYDLTEVDYHRDMVVGGSLSSTGARTLIAKTPAHFDWARNHPPVRKRQFDLGHAFHVELLGVGQGLALIDAKDYRTKAAQTARDEAYEADLVPVLTGAKDGEESELEQVEAMVAAVRAHSIAGPLFARPGVAEQSLVGRDPETGVMCRARLDWMPDVPDGAPLIGVDLKSTVDASPAAFASSMAKWGYHQQRPFYTDVLEWVEPRAEAPKFVLVAVDKEPPHLVSVGEPDATAVEWGRVLNRKARDLYARCTETGEWPGYPLEIASLSLPAWAIREYELADEAGAYLTTADLIGATA